MHSPVVRAYLTYISMNLMTRTSTRTANVFTRVDLKERNVVLGKNNKKDVAEECRDAYKDIDTVMENQKDLTIPVKKMFTVGVVKG